MPIDKGDVFTKFEQVRKAIRELPLQVGAEAEGFFKSNFDKQGWQGSRGFEPWVKRKDPKASRSILIGKGTAHLKKGIRKFVTGNTVMVKVTGVATKYADIHNFGGVIEVRVTERMRRWCWYMFKRTGKEFYKRMAISKKDTLKIHMPQRQFIGNSTQLDARIETLIEGKLSKALS
jgi:phage gpG-like protein